MCCQESGEREATVSLLCPKALAGEPRIRKVKTTTTNQAKQTNISNPAFF